MSRRDALMRWSRAPRAAGARPRLPYRSWALDAGIAVVLAVGTVIGDLNRSYVVVRMPEVPVPPAERIPSLPQLPHPVPASEHLLPPVEPWEFAAAVLTALPLLLRRRYPITVYWAVLGAALLLHRGEVSADATTYTFASGLVAAYSAAVHGPHRKAVVASLLAGVVLYAAFPLVPEVDKGLVPVLVLLPVGFAAHGVHIWRQRARALQEEQRAALRRAVDEERSRIARELHDVVTHNVSMMTIQAGAARKVLDTEPGQAKDALLAVEAAGRSAMSELRHVMGLLTMAADGPDPAAGADLAPQPGLDRLPELAERVRATGVRVELSLRVSPVGLPAGVDLAAYRVVQEALTNAVKHAAGAAVSIVVEQVPGELRVDVTDSAGRSGRAGTGGGYGLVGLRERLAMYGGTLHADRRPGGGFHVRAVIPVEVP
ncbi:sensor histidine kinase [Streptomyces sp. NPDC004126]|uniref:sensor histidine kinase n=1 Tax=Streptomyces sp. NPDC004126 TaxID=3390695 RepID=UPI003CFCBA6A